MVIAYSVYFDESGTHRDSPCMSMAAYAFQARDARLFSRDWAKDLQSFGLSAAHMTDCALGFGEYSKMSIAERVKTEKALIKHVRKRSMFGLALTVAPAHYMEKMSAAEWGFSAYTCLLLLLTQKVSSMIAETDAKASVSYIFEAGHEKSTEANAYLNFAARTPFLRSRLCYANHSFVDKREGLPLQAADMLAWQSRHFSVRRAEGHQGMRKDFEALLRPVDLFAEVPSQAIEQLAVFLHVGKAVHGVDSNAFENIIRSAFR